MTPDIEARVMGKVKRRLLPFMFLLYIICYIDRINVGFAALEMNKDLNLSAAVYGLGSGIFFLGYFLFEVPSNLILARVGARVWITRIMITWGLISSAMMFIQGPHSFYALRFLLGLAEAGFFPGMILYLTYWFPSQYRAQAVALFMTAAAVAGIISGPVSGLLLTMHSLGGLAGWQWLFLLEGLPAVMVGVIVWFYLTDGPAQAHWLSPEERLWLLEALRVEQQNLAGHGLDSLNQVLVNGKVWLLALIYFTITIGLYGLGLWMPLMIESFSGYNELMVGLVSVVPYLAGVGGMVATGIHSDRCSERYGHAAGSMFLAAAGFVLCTWVSGPIPGLAALSLASVGIWCVFGPFWALPTSFLRGSAAAGGIALINSVGNLGGFVGPNIIGLLKEYTGDFKYGLLCLGGIFIGGGLLILFMKHRTERFK